MTGAELLCRTLESLGVDVLFGLPGTQTVPLYEALRRSSIRAIVPTNELAATFMAVGYARVSGRVGVVTTIPGPGFTYALTGLAEARLDSAAVVHIVPAATSANGRVFGLQAIDQLAIAAPLAKAVYVIDRAEELAAHLTDAFHDALVGEPGPVLVQLRPGLLGETIRGPVGSVDEKAGDPTAGHPIPDEARALIRAARRPIIMAGLGAAGAADRVRELAETMMAPVFTTPSGRGVLPEDHPLALCFDPARGGIETLNELVETTDLVLALGCKLGHNGTAGFALRIPQDRLINVNTDATALAGNYPARIAVHSSVGAFLDALLRADPAGNGAPLASGSDAPEDGPTGWQPEEIARWRNRLRAPAASGPPEPAIHGTEEGTAAALIEALRRALPPDAVLVTDSGLHQTLVRRHFDVHAPRGLILPADFQSMGFGLPAALGANLAAPGRPVVAVVGDGGFAMSGLELLTAAREGIPVVVVVFNDGHFNLIRLQQFGDYGRAHGVSLRNPDFVAFAAAVGARYLRVEGDAESVLRAAIEAGGPTLVEVKVGDSTAIRTLQAGRLAREAARAVLGPGLVTWLKARFGG